jgi:hypothetical protein
MEKTARIGILMVLLAFALTACATGGTWTPLPTTDSPEPLKIIPPGSEIPPIIANYSGIWEGVFDNGRPVTVVVEEISVNSVTAIYSWGRLNNSPDGWIRVKGKIKDDSIVLEWNRGIVTLSPGKSKDDAILKYERQVILYAYLKKRHKS